MPTGDDNGAQDIRAEYSAVVAYHTALVVARFTIAGLLLAASGFLASAIFRQEVSFALKAFGCAFGTWITFSVLVLELRTRALFTSLAHRGIDIEHRYWGLTGADWYAGFFSRQHKIPPQSGADGILDSAAPPEPGPDIPWIALLGGRPLPAQLARYVSHSTGFELLYVGALTFWAIATVVYGSRYLSS